MASTPRRRSKTGGTSSSSSTAKTRRKRSGTGQAKRSSTSSTTSSGGFAGLTQARTIGKKLQNYHVKGLELVNEFVAMLPASRPATRGRRASTSTT